MSMCSTENLAKQDITTTDAVTNRLKKVLFLCILQLTFIFGETFIHR